MNRHRTTVILTSNWRTPRAPRHQRPDTEAPPATARPPGRVSADDGTVPYHAVAPCGVPPKSKHAVISMDTFLLFGLRPAHLETGLQARGSPRARRCAEVGEDRAGEGEHRVMSSPIHGRARRQRRQRRSTACLDLSVVAPCRTATATTIPQLAHRPSAWRLTQLHFIGGRQRQHRH